MKYQVQIQQLSTQFMRNNICQLWIQLEWYNRYFYKIYDASMKKVNWFRARALYLWTWVDEPHESLNTLRPRQNGRHSPDDIFKSIFMNENIWILIAISLKFVPKGPINNIPALVQIMAWRRPGDKPLSEPMMVSLLTHICVTRPQWVKSW